MAVAIICLFGLILCISALYAELGGRRFEACLPLAVGSMIIVLYVAGLAGALSAGVWAVIGAGGLAGISALALAGKRGHLKKLAASLFTPGMAIYAVLCAAVYVANTGKPVKTWDEFSYWADAVKIMTQMGVLPSDPAARSLFASYPPALPLWQYLLQGINGVINGAAAFEEPMLFMSYQWFMLALYMPFLDRLTWRRPVEAAVCATAVPLVALSVFDEAFNLLYSDALLGTLGGFVCAYAFFHRRMDWFDLATQAALLSVLTLTKDAGMLFAAAGVAMVGVNAWLDGGRKTGRLLPVLACIAAVAFARGSWSLHVAASGAAQASMDQSVSLGALLDPAQHWRITTMRNFAYRFFEKIFPVQGTTLSISYCAVFALLAAGFLTVRCALKKADDQRAVKWLSAVVFAASGAYIIGTGLAYAFTFYEDEAVRLASYERYLNIAVLFAAFVLFACFARMRMPAWPDGIRRRTLAGALAVFVLFVPFTRLLDAVSGLDAEAARQGQQDYQTLTEKVFSVAEETDRVYVIAAGSSGFERVIMRYRLRPLYVGDDPWNIGVGIEESRLAAERTPEEFLRRLTEDYDLLVIAALTEEFRQTYGEVFLQPENLAAGQVYRVDQKTGLLALVI